MSIIDFCSLYKIIGNKISLLCIMYIVCLNRIKIIAMLIVIRFSKYSRSKLLIVINLLDNFNKIKIRQKFVSYSITANTM